MSDNDFMIIDEEEKEEKTEQSSKDENDSKDDGYEKICYICH